MTVNQIIEGAWGEVIKGINADIFKYSMVKPMPATWVEQKMILPSNTSRYPGPYSYDLTPYWREPINHLHESSPVRYVSILKSVQIGATAGIVIPGILYIIAIDPDNTLFTAGDLFLAKKTIEERLDTILRESKLDHLIRPHAVKKGNQRTGDTAASKEFSGGTLTALGTGSANSFRYFSAKKSFVDDFDTAPRDLGGEGSVKSLIEGRQNSFGDSAQTFFISTPTETSTSNIWEQYQLGTMKKWNWPCYNCGALMMMDWKITLSDNSYAGIIWRLDGKGHLVKDSVAFRCPHCGEITQEKSKYECNKNGLWVSTVDRPVEELHESYSTNAIIQPPGFTGWVKLVQEWLAANPQGQKANIIKLKAFMNLRLGLPFEETGITPKSTALMENTRTYHPGIVPDKTAEIDLNGKIILVTLACDLNGEQDDARLDWEILAHAASGATYSVNHGSIGTFVRTRDRGKPDAEKESNRQKWTYVHNMEWDKHDNKAGSVWPELERIIKSTLESESGLRDRNIDISVIDTGHWEKLAMQFVVNMQEQGVKIFGVKGKVEAKYRKNQRDTAPLKRSTERPKQLYLIEVNQMKYDLAQMMQLRPGDEGSAQPMGFMNFPQPNDGKYLYPNYFSHYEGEVMKEEKDGNQEVIGYRWEKKTSQSQNHFWDIRVYNLAAPLIYLDQVKLSDPAKYKFLTWEDFVLMVTA